MNKTCIVYDFESDSVDPETTNIIQIAALAIDPERLQIIPDSEFNSWSCPDDITNPRYYEDHKKTIDWHAKNHNTTPEKFITKVKACPNEKLVFENFVEYLKKYHTKPSGQTIYTSPMLAGFNSFTFDNIILDRLCKKYGRTDVNGKQNLYFTRDTIDIMKMATMWIGPTNDLRSFSMDSIREYMGLSTFGAHEALKDVRDEAAILIKFLGLHQTLAKKVQFKDCFKKDA